MKIWLEFFRKWPLQAIAAKLESAGTKSFLLENAQEPSGWNRICQILILTLWPVTLAQIRQKSNRIFPVKEKEDRALTLLYLDSPMAKVFPLRCLFCFISVIFRGKRAVKVGPKIQSLGRCHSVKKRKFSKIWKKLFLSL